MSAMRKVVVSVIAFLLGFSAMFMTTGTAAADCDWNVTACQVAN